MTIEFVICSPAFLPFCSNGKAAGSYNLQLFLFLSTLFSLLCSLLKMGLKHYYYRSSNTTLKFNFYIVVTERKIVKTRLPEAVKRYICYRWHANCVVYSMCEHSGQSVLSPFLLLSARFSTKI